MADLEKAYGAHDGPIIGVEDLAFEAVLASATGADDRIVAVGNPLAPKGKFFGTHRPSSAWHQLRIAATDHANVREGRTLIPDGPTVEWLDRVRGIAQSGLPFFGVILPGRAGFWSWC